MSEAAVGPVEHHLVLSRFGAGWVDRSEAPIFLGLVRSVAVDPVAASLIRMTGRPVRTSMVRFDAGARTRLHTHDGDQILVIVEGRGHVGVPAADNVVVPGDVVVVPAGVLHYHGASTEEPMAHMTTLFGNFTAVSKDELTWPPTEQGTL